MALLQLPFKINVCIQLFIREINYVLVKIKMYIM